MGEAIVIGEGIEIEILEIGPSKVKLGIHAVVDIPVQRKEMMRASQQNRQAAALTVQTQKALAKNLCELFSKLPAVGTDKNFEARYSGHPSKEENLEPA